MHVHNHLITTSGGLSLDGSKWIAVDANHPALQADYLAARFKRMFLRKLKWMVRREQLIWPTIDQLPASFEALGMISRQQMLRFVDPLAVEPNSRNSQPINPISEDPMSRNALASGCLASGWEHDSEQVDIDQPPDQEPDANALRLIKTQPRVLSTIEKSFFAILDKKTWIAHSQPTPSHLQGADQIINYLSHYVAGSMISDHRILSDAGQFVTIRIKDYKAGDVKAFTLPAVELVRRWVMHILPKHLARVRYGGIFAPQQREERLTHLCRTHRTSEADCIVQRKQTERNRITSSLRVRRGIHRRRTTGA